jgi:hypothetical protein
MALPALDIVGRDQRGGLFVDGAFAEHLHPPAGGHTLMLCAARDRGASRHPDGPSVKLSNDERAL